MFRNFGFEMQDSSNMLLPLQRREWAPPYSARTKASAGCKGRRPVACSTCCLHEMPGATSTAFGLLSTAGKRRRRPIAMEMS